MRQVDSLIRFSEQVKSLRELKSASDSLVILERARFYNEQVMRRKEAENYQLIIDGFTAVEKGKNNEIAVITKKYKGQVRKNRFMFILLIAAGSFGVYSSLK